MKTIFLLTSGLLCFHLLSCSDEGCPDNNIRLNGSCVLYTGNAATSPGQTYAGGPTTATAGSATMGGSQGGATGGAPATVQGGSVAASSGAGGEGGAPASSDPEGGDGAEAAGGAPTVQAAAFGDLCTASADCGGDTNYCATPPTEPFYCTVSGCDETPTLCPAGYECFDLGQFVAGEPFICTKIPEVGNGAFADICQTSADCSGETNYCVSSPTEAPYCSVSGCDSAPELCPDGWSCFDVGQFVPGEPFTCVKPAP